MYEVAAPPPQMKKRLVGDCRLYADKCTSASRLVIVTSLQEITSKCYKRKVIKRSRANIAVSKPRLNQTPSHKITLPPPLKKIPKQIAIYLCTCLDGMTIVWHMSKKIF